MNAQPTPAAFLDTISQAMPETELRRLLQRADIAIGFALEHLEAFEAPAFLRAWRDGHDLGPWLPTAKRSAKIELPDNDLTPGAWVADKEASLAKLRAPLSAIQFALRALQPFEIADFLKQWAEGRDLKPWLDALHHDQDMAGEDMPDPSLLGH
ncbi:MAG: hypothetical protein E5V67_24220 [Mesorhizobium sp.]|uniref:hypothetical protein n=1 Tax=unclassified Mesorhizobium TaxID=325217 RepID=UPI000BAED0B6|nr:MULTISPECIES: hypothetical protein [unclassified Mesorhizobium]TGV89071.1 hypothetical protein EN801_021315 [Mesorhizobium sp. M00.F.Ca.ET.158.01.1.1]TIU83793.1 MAG: hypothetical protein E5W06_18320 [Mesorhizobium sp.]PBB39575.1 hypothetical protein CK221_01770 [Mesorhizobium sp. WSM3868]TGQ19368.1 hypothetical protein EN860_019780 [Mesorhizobium sp. M00.F.Ca.ET.217.01.1.1]TKB31661.1 MAG: hypothetical protein E5V67_24220 [Mesorhizobium sp.]